MITATVMRNVWVCMCTSTSVKSSLQYECVCNCHMDSNTTTIWTVTCDFSKQCTLSFFTRHNTTMLCHTGNFLNHLTFVDVETLQAMLTQPQSPVSENPGTKLNLMHNRSRERAHTHTMYTLDGRSPIPLLAHILPALVPMPPPHF